MTQREIRKILFEILFEKEIINDVDVNKRIDERVSENDMSSSKEEFLRTYVNEIVDNNEEIKKEIGKNLKGWSFDTIGTAEKVVFKIAFYELLMKKVGHQIVINEALVLTNDYGDEKSKDFINGVLANLIN